MSELLDALKQELEMLDGKNGPVEIERNFEGLKKIIAHIEYLESDQYRAEVIKKYLKNKEKMKQEIDEFFEKRKGLMKSLAIAEGANIPADEAHIVQDGKVTAKIKNLKTCGFCTTPCGNDWCSEGSKPEFHYECPKCDAFITGAMEALDDDLNVTCQSCDFEGMIEECVRKIITNDGVSHVTIDMSKEPPMTQEEIQANYNRLLAKGRIDIPDEEE